MSTTFIRGIGDNNTAKIYPGENGDATLQYEGCCGIFSFMELDKSSAEAITLFGSEFEQEINFFLKPTLLFNEISDPDSHRGALRSCGILCDKMQLPVINHPDRILKTTRENIPILLQDIPGLTVPETIRFRPLSPGDIFSEIESSGIGYPAIVRLAGSHGGKTTILVRSRDDIDKLHVYPFDGSDFYLTRFVDYVSNDGYYRKYRIVVIDGVPLYRHHLVYNQWMIHASSSAFLDANEFLALESRERRLTFNSKTLPIIQPAIDEITKRLQLEYYGIDCNIDDQGNILIFEVNANMNILFNQTPSLNDQLSQIRMRILNLLDKYAAS